jgi:MoxR-like ATPase
MEKWIEIGGVKITLSPPRASPLARLLSGRAWVVEEEPEGEEIDISNVASRLVSLRDEVASRFVGLGEVAEAVAVALASGEHVFLLGPPGTAKSTLARLFAEGVGGKFWRMTFNPDTTREDVFGPIDPVAYAESGVWRRRWSGLATCDIALLDEFWKASPQVNNICLEALEERRVSGAEGEVAIPLLAAIVASNEAPEEKERMAAYDRLLIRLSVGYVCDPDEFSALLRADAGRRPMPNFVSSDEIRLLAAASEWFALNLPPILEEGMLGLWQEVGRNGRAVSNRRWVRTAKAAVASSLLSGEEPEARHLAVARWTLWSDPDEEQDVRNLVLGLTDPVAGEVLEMEALLADLKAQAAGLEELDLAGRAELAGKAKRLQSRALKLQKEPDAKPYSTRIKTVLEESTDIINAVLDVMGGLEE